MSTTEPFTGLGMPVFTAFGWAGEEAAIQFALSQLDIFIKALHKNLSGEAKGYFPYSGLDKESKTVYISSHKNPTDGVYVTFNARPVAFDVRMNIVNDDMLNKGLKAAEKNIPAWHRFIIQLGPDWSLHIRQRHVDEESGEVSNYQDLFKDEVTKFSLETCEEITSRTAFLTSEQKWTTPIHLVRSLRAEQAANMGAQIAEHLAEEVENLLTIVNIFQKGKSRAAKKKKSSGRATVTVTKSAEPAPEAAVQTAVAEPANDPVEENNSDQFTYISTLKPLHIRKGFVNLTPKHWPFFAKSARSGSREITLCYEGQIDQGSSVWRLQPSDMARLVLSEPAQQWLENKFSADDRVRVVAAKLSEEEIQVTLTAGD